MPLDAAPGRLSTLLEGDQIGLRIAGIYWFAGVNRLTRVVCTGIIIITVRLVIAAVIVVAVVVAAAAVVFNIDLVDNADVSGLLVGAGREKKKGRE